MKWVIVGGGGQLGQALSTFLDESTDTYTSLSKFQLDITNRSRLMELLVSEKPDIVINAAAWTNVDSAEERASSVFEINVKGTYNLAICCLELGITLVQLSTDYVFGGNQTQPIEEDARKFPLSVYGRSKAIAEDIVLGVLPETGIIVRTSWLYSRWGTNFAKTILDKLATLEKGTVVSVVNDQIGQPTSASELSQQLHTIGHNRVPAGIYHATNSGAVSWCEFALKIQELSGMDQVLIAGVKSEGWPAKAKRPSFSVLSNSKLELLGLNSMSNWERALEIEMPYLIGIQNRTQMP